MRRPTLASRRERVARLAAKRPPDAIPIEVERVEPDEVRRRKLVVLLAALLTRDVKP